LFTAVCQCERGLGYVDIVWDFADLHISEIFNLGSAGEVVSDLASF